MVYIAGSGHSGTTIFDLALGGHSAIVGLGEVHLLSIAAGRDDEYMRCGCGRPVGSCGFWAKVALELGARSVRRSDVDATLKALPTMDRITVWPRSKATASIRRWARTPPVGRALLA